MSIHPAASPAAASSVPAPFTVRPARPAPAPARGHGQDDTPGRRIPPERRPRGTSEAHASILAARSGAG